MNQLEHEIFRISKVFRTLASLLILVAIATPQFCVAQDSEFSIELRPRTAKANRRKLSKRTRFRHKVKKSGGELEDRISRGVAGVAVQSAMERIKSLGERSDPVAKGNPTVPGKLVAADEGTPGLEGQGQLPKTNSSAPNLPNFPGPPPNPSPQSIIPKLCQLAQQIVQAATQGGQKNSQSAGGGSSSSCGPTG